MAPPPRPDIDDRYQLDDRYAADRGTVFMTGIQALARLPLEQLRVDRNAGLRTAAFVSGYPGSPLGGFDKAIAQASRIAADLPIVCRPALNEEYAATAVMGSQLAAVQPDARYDGIVGIWYGKAPGVDRATDALRHAVYAGSASRGGAIALVGDDPNAKSSTLPSSSAGSLLDMHIPVLYPGDPAEALDLGRHAIAIARCTGLWASLKIVADVADGSATVELNPDRIDPILPLHNGDPYAHVPDGRLLTPHTIELEREIYEVRYALAVEYASANRLNRATVDPPDAWIGIVASGITYREVREALHRLGLRTDSEIFSAGIRLLKMQMPAPFNPITLRNFARGLEEIFVVEEKQPTLESLIKDALYNHTEHPLVTGKRDHEGRPLVAGHGSLGADEIIPALRSRLERVLAERLAAEPSRIELIALPGSARRSPFYCSGCPHNRSTQVPEGSLVGAGIGCHTMAMLMDEDRVGNIAALTCMGNEGAQWIGMSEFVERRHLLQNLGDGTFFHSGQLAIQAAIAADVTLTYKILWNGAVAMTGGQEPQGRTTIADVAQILLAQGAAAVLVTSDDVARTRQQTLPDGVDVWDRTRILEAQQKLSRMDGVTVLIHDQACAAELRRARKRGLAPTPDRRVAINPRLCEGCGDCGRKSACLSVQPVETPYGRKTAIDQTSCNLDFSCLEGDCPSFMTIQTRGGTSPSSGPHEDTVPSAPTGLPDPVVPDARNEFAMRIVGIGGTGVVTVSQVLGTAAARDGLHVSGLDQIGLSQKAGPVVSDLRFGRDQPAATNRLGRGQADLILAFDALVAAAPNGLTVADPQRTAVVGSTTETPTGAMVTQPELTAPQADALRMRIAGGSRADQQYWADAAAITGALFGSAVTANLFVVGMAVQAGVLPIRPDSIEWAIELNGVAAETNREAFRWGRARIAEPETVEAAIATRNQPAETGDAAERALPRALELRISQITDPEASGFGVLLRRLAGDLVAFQSTRYAAQYLDRITEIARSEQSVDPTSTRLSQAAARSLHKLMAYKDEYEVARLMLHPEGLADARRIANGDARITWLLHPPLLRALGWKHKIRVGRWAAPALRVLAACRFLRGTPLDPFGSTKVRRIERELPGEFCSALVAIASDLKPELLDDAVAIARMPQDVRGYESIKLARVRAYREELAEALAQYGG